MTTLLVDRLAFTYPGGFRAGPLSLSADRGVVHLLGANGTGKTTLLRCVCGEYRRSEGELRVRGRDPRREVAARRDVAFQAAEPELPDALTVDEAWQQLAAVRQRPDWDGASLRERFQLPGTLRLGQCSAGQRRLAEFLAAAAGDPAVLLLDEPFANLDVGRVAVLRDALVDWARERVVVVTSHQPLPMGADVEVRLGGG